MDCLRKNKREWILHCHWTSSADIRSLYHRLKSQILYAVEAHQVSFYVNGNTTRLVCSVSVNEEKGESCWRPRKELRFFHEHVWARLNASNAAQLAFCITKTVVVAGMSLARGTFIVLNTTDNNSGQVCRSSSCIYIFVLSSLLFAGFSTSYTACLPQENSLVCNGGFGMNLVILLETNVNGMFLMLRNSVLFRLDVLNWTTFGVRDMKKGDFAVWDIY